MPVVASNYGVGKGVTSSQEMMMYESMTTVLQSSSTTMLQSIGTTMQTSQHSVSTVHSVSTAIREASILHHMSSKTDREPIAKETHVYLETSSITNEGIYCIIFMYKEFISLTE